MAGLSRKAPTGKESVHRRDKFYPIMGPLSRLCSPFQSVSAPPLPETDTMTDATAAAPATDPRDILARRIYDEVIGSPHLTTINALNDWLRLMTGLGGYLACSAASIDSSLPPLGEHVDAVGHAIEKAGKIAYILADAVEIELYQLRHALAEHRQTAGEVSQ